MQISLLSCIRATRLLAYDPQSWAVVPLDGSIFRQWMIEHPSHFSSFHLVLYSHKRQSAVRQTKMRRGNISPSLRLCRYGRNLDIRYLCPLIDMSPIQKPVLIPLARF